MKLKTKIFNLCNGRYQNLAELSKMMGVSQSLIYGVRKGSRNINGRFIIGAMKAFPGYNLDNLFYISKD
ncbi:hypothetical protein ACFLX8_03775 [Chloroflexota bacterium]